MNKNKKRSVNSKVSSYEKYKFRCSLVTSNDMIASKKASAPFIAWVLLMAFAVALSAFMYSFMIDYAKDETSSAKERVYNTDECRQVSLSIESACSSTASQVLNITLQNRNYIRVNRIDFRLYDGVVPINTRQTNTTLNPNRKKLISVDTNTTRDVTFVEVIPRLTVKDVDIICSEKTVESVVNTC